jgi:hypothetical protein
LGCNEELNATRDTGLASDQSGAFEGENHLMDRGWSDPEEALQIGLGRRSAVDLRVGMASAPKCIRNICRIRRMVSLCAGIHPSIDCNREA